MRRGRNLALAEKILDGDFKAGWIEFDPPIVVRFSLNGAGIGAPVVQHQPFPGIDNDVMAYRRDRKILGVFCAEIV
jgi:hypothetical protein